MSVLINDLPDEIKFLVFSKLDPQSLCNSASVCKDWNRICEEEVLWRNLCLKEQPFLQEERDVLIDWKGFFSLGSLVQFRNQKKTHCSSSHKVSIGFWTKILILFCIIVSLLGTFYVMKQHYILSTYIPVEATITSSQVISIDVEDDDRDDISYFSPLITYEYECTELVYDDDDGFGFNDIIFDIPFVDIIESDIQTDAQQQQHHHYNSTSLFPLEVTSTIGKEEYANNIVTEYKVGNSAIIYHDPYNCDFTFLLRYADFTVYLFIICPIIVIYLIFIFLNNKKMVSRDQHHRYIKSYDRDYHKWLYEIPNMEIGSFNLINLRNFNIAISILFHLFGTCGFIHFYLMTSQDDQIVKLESRVFTMSLCFAISLFGIYPILRFVQYHRLVRSFSDVQIRLGNTHFKIGDQAEIYVKQIFYTSLHINKIRAIITRYKVDESEKFLSRKASFSRTLVLLSNYTTSQEGEKLSLSGILKFPDAIHLSNNQSRDHWFLTIKIDVNGLPYYSKEMPICVKY